MSRYLDARAFSDETKKLKVWSSYLNFAVLERLEKQRSLIPRMRLRYPDEIERRWWAKAHPGYKKVGVKEPNGPRWKDACDLERLRQDRPPFFSDPTVTPHPLDQPEARFRQFIQNPARRKFMPWDDYRVQVGTTKNGPLYTSETVVTYYSAWQVLLFAEVVNMGALALMNLAVEGAYPSDEAVGAAPRTLNWIPIQAMRGFAKHARTLDAIVWYAEEAGNGFEFATRHDHKRRLLAEEERAEIMRTRLWAAHEAKKRHRVSTSAVIEATKFLCERWADWEREGRPLITKEYKAFISRAVQFGCLIGRMDYATYRKAVGKAGGFFKPILDVIFVNWEGERRDDAQLILTGFSRPDALLTADFSKDTVERFLDFIERQSLHGFYWRLESFNRHAFSGAEHSLEHFDFNRTHILS